MSWYIRPEEIIAELRRVYPTERFTEPQRPIAPRVSMANEYLYGVPIYVYGEGVKGQYLRHSMYQRDGRRYWVIEYGWVSLYGRMDDGKIIPLVMLGMPTRLVFQLRPRDLRGYVLEEVPMGSLEVEENKIVNLERVMSGSDPIMIIDMYNLLRSGDGATPTEFIDRVIDLQRQVEALQKAVWEYEKQINDYRVMISVLEARNAKLLELVRSYEHKMVKLYTEITAIQNELIRLREEIVVRAAEAESLEEARRRLRNIVDGLVEIVSAVSEAVSTIHREVATVKRVVAATQEKREGGGEK